MDRLKRYTVIGIIFALITGTLAHFVYGWTGNHPAAALFFPVNESTWEHMKLVFFPSLVFGLFIIIRLGREYPCVHISVPAGILAGTFLVPVLFYTYTGILGFHTLLLDILVFVLSVLAAFYIILKKGRSCDSSSQNSLFLLVILMTAAFFIFSYYPPELGIFESPV